MIARENTKKNASGVSEGITERIMCQESSTQQPSSTSTPSLVTSLATPLIGTSSSLKDSPDVKRSDCADIERNEQVGKEEDGVIEEEYADEYEDEYADEYEDEEDDDEGEEEGSDEEEEGNGEKCDGSSPKRHKTD